MNKYIHFTDIDSCNHTFNRSTIVGYSADREIVATILYLENGSRLFINKLAVDEVKEKLEAYDKERIREGAK